MITKLVDPRDVTWKQGNPVFRVQLWRPIPPRSARETASPPESEAQAFESQSFDIEQAQVAEVLRWIEDQHLGEGEHYTLHLLGRNTLR